jgi:chitinase
MWLSLSSASVGAVATSLLLLSAAATTRVDGGSIKLNQYLAAHPVPIKAAAAVPASGSTKANALAPKLITAVLSECPSGCVDAGSSPSNWTVYPRLGRLAMCNQTMLLNFSLHTSLRKDETIRACTADSTAIAGHTTKDASCLPNGSTTLFHQSLQLAFNKTATPATGADLAATAQQLAAAWSQRNSSACTDTTAFAYSNTAALGLFAGAGVGNLPTAVLQDFFAKIKTPGFSGSAVVQLCAKDGSSSKYSFGIVASGGGDVRVVQDAVAAWASAECLSTYDAAEDWHDKKLSVPSLSLLGNGTAGNVTTAPSRNSTVPI